VTWQVLLLVALPLFLVVDVWVIFVGYRGRTRQHAVARCMGVLGVLLFLLSAFALMDQVSQVWVQRSGGGGGTIYVVSLALFATISIIALLLGVNLVRGDRSV